MGAFVALLLTLLALDAMPAAAAPVYPASFEERNAITGVWMPVAVGWTPDGRTLIAEKPASTRRCPTGRKARRGASRRGSAATKPCKKPRGRKRGGQGAAT